MARYVYEFFRPWGEPAIYPLGVIAQDDSGLVYGDIEGAEIPAAFQTGFFLVSGRGPFIAGQLLPRLGIDDPASPAVFAALAGRATHRFLYSDVAEAAGSASEVARAEADRLRDPAELAALIARHSALATAE